MSGKLWKTMENEWKTMENYGKLKSLWRKKTGTHSKKLDRDAPKMASDVNGNFMRRKKLIIFNFGALPLFVSLNDPAVSYPAMQRGHW